MKIKHYDLFAGIGGFSYALDTVFGEYEREHVFCEWEAFPTAVLKKHWPDATYYGDIADLVADTKCNGQHRASQSGSTDTCQAKRGLSQPKRCSGSSSSLRIVTGGFPCQPFSHAGRRQGTSDDRYKWPEMFAVIRNVRPDWVIAENVRGLVTWNDGLVLETVCADLESEGYEVQPLVIPACAVGAPHRRDRVWIVAHATNSDDRGDTGELSQENEQQAKERQEEWITKLGGTDSGAATNTGRKRWSEGASEGLRPTGQEPEQPNGSNSSFGWDTDWREVALATCNDGMDDGLPRRMDGVTISAARHRKERLKACGNAIVPQVAMQIFGAIKNV